VRVHIACNPSPIFGSYQHFLWSCLQD